MPIIIPLGVPYSGNPANAVTLPTSATPTPIPEIWNGLQCFFDMSYAGAAANPLFAAGYQTVAWQSKYGYQLFDAADRLRWTDTSGFVHNYAFRFGPTNGSWPTVQTGARAVNGKAALSTKTGGHVIRVSGDAYDGTSNAAFQTNDYTMLVVYKAEVGAVGGIVGQGEAYAHDSAFCWARFGFKSVTNDGTTIWQHRNDAPNRIVVAKDTANGLPTLAIVTGATGNAGNVYLKNNGTELDTPFTFTNTQTGTNNSPFCLGYQDGSAGNAKFRDIACFARWNRVLTAAEITYLKSFMTTYYGAF